ncbi:PucR family transcriptional regulator [Thermobifida halotolerans]|uniref:PucR family transcriptional regulator n=1 Tax=Thermobifida halotolerans TaxID=483545 RepID=UPI0008380587|nr:PucR family transcriptional regulator [Thermobifida halotolerans]
MSAALRHDGAPDPQTVPLRAILTRRDLALDTLVPASPDAGVRWATVSELVDPTPYLLGGELLLTAGTNLPEDPDTLDRYVSTLLAAEVTALGFGVTPVYDAVPAALVERCRVHGLPLLLVPRETPFVAVSQAVGEELEHRRLADQRRFVSAGRALTRAAVGNTPVQGVLETLSSVLGCWTTLIGARPLGRAGRVPTLSAETGELVGKVGAAGGPLSAKIQVSPDRVVLHAVGEHTRERSVLLLGRPEPLDATDRAILGTAVALLGLLSRSQSAVVDDAGRLAARLLLSGSEPDTASFPPLRALLSGGDRTDVFRVLHARWTGRGARPTASPTLFRTRLVDDTGTSVRAVLADQGSREEHLALLDELRASGWLAAVSGPVSGTGLATADRQAAALLVRAHATDRPLLPDEAPDPFDTLFEREAARTAARTLLGPLAGPGETARTLRATLRAWLARHGSWDRAAADLGAHRNSVRYRIGRIERDLGVDLSDPEQRMRLWFALSRFDEDAP